MQINLKQPEIIEALKQYVAHKGISLVGKDVAIAFTAGRKETGLSAEITIENQEIPDFFASEDSAPTLKVVPATIGFAAVSTGNIVDSAPEPEAKAEPAVAEAPAKTSSLFS